MSNSQPCHGQRSISPCRSSRYSPGRSAVNLPSTNPMHNGAPSCGQRLISAKNSPCTLNTPMERPATSTILLVPGAISLTGATTCRAIPSLQAVERQSVLAEYHPLVLLGQRRLEGVTRIVLVPVRIVGREHDAVPTDPLTRRQQILGPLRLLDRLRRHPDVGADVFRRQPFQMRHFLAQPLVVLVEPPCQRGQPGEAAFHQCYA